MWRKFPSDLEPGPNQCLVVKKNTDDNLKRMVASGGFQLIFVSDLKYLI